MSAERLERWEEDTAVEATPLPPISDGEAWRQLHREHRDHIARLMGGAEAGVE